MSNNEIVEKYYPFIMELKQKFGADDDCVQMIFVEILEYSNPKLNQLDSKNELKFFIFPASYAVLITSSTTPLTFFMLLLIG